ncbi:MAG TPA: hypothetical protein DD761_11915 [Cyanobacteria bacterium UBA11691]|nr:hypothetical protein [Cyanobacteria bacterium UBA11691]
MRTQVRNLLQENHMKTPHQSLPVNRAKIFHLDLVLVSHKDSQGKLRQQYKFARGSKLNCNEPAQFSEPIDCGCYLFSGISKTSCLSACGLV